MIRRTLLHYRITERLGAGGMGEVYRATDTKLGRDVAIKVLPEAFARDKERLARFEREARVLASLNHPNIAAIYGLEQAEGRPFLVLEYVPGPTLAEMLAAGSIEVDEALRVGGEIALALEHAHEKAIVHRDLKPANVKVTPEGKVKVLDFGLAKALAEEASDSDPTRAGVIMGTAAYMSPEQALGRPLDKRTDIWAFGCVLYEMLAGRRAFEADNITDTIAAIVKTEPDWAALPAATPAKVRELLRRCLHKDRERRLRDVGEEDARGEPDRSLTVAPQQPAAQQAAAQIPERRRRVGPMLAVGVLGMVATGVAVWLLKPPPASLPRTPKRMVLPIPGEQAINTGRALAVSPDGSRLAYVASQGGRRQLFLRLVDKLESTPIRGTEDASAPFFSPDGQWLGFGAAGQLKKVAVTGGAPRDLGAASDFMGASWGPDDTIVFAETRGLWRIPASGGAPKALATPDTGKGERAYSWPEWLPGGKALLFNIAVGTGPDEARIAVLSIETGERRVLLEGGTGPRYSPTGHIYYGRAGGLMAAPFDLKQLRATGTPVPVVEGVFTGVSGSVSADLSSDGSLFYVAVARFYVAGATAGTGGRSLVWVDRKGSTWPLTERKAYFHDPRLSPDGRRVAINITAARNELWILDLASDSLTRMTIDADHHGQAWTPDGKRLAFGSAKTGPRTLFWKPSDGSGAEEPLATNGREQFATSWAPDGRALAFHDRDGSGYDMWVLRLDGDRKPQPFLKTQFNEGGAVFSPDGRWLAYQSDESGRYEVYVQPYPGPGGKSQISSEGGVEPVWARNGRELFYRNGDKMMAVDVEARPSFSAGKPKLLFQGQYVLCPELRPHGGRAGAVDRGKPPRPHGPAAYYDVTPDGQRFLMIKGEQESSQSQVYVVTDWLEELRRKAGNRR